MKNKIIINIILIICICVFLYSGYYVFLWLKFDKDTKELEKGLYKDVVSFEKKQEDNQKEVLSIDFQKLKEINSDIIAWIKIDNTHINYPIFQGETDEYYLRKDIYKKYNFSGSIFVYSNIDKDFQDENTLIYGHNMKNDRMFADIYEIYRGNLGNNIDVMLYTEKEARTYKVFSCYVEKPNLYITKSCFTAEEKKEYIDNAIKKSKIDFKPNINYESKMITLVTCASTSEERVVAHAIQIK